MPKNIVICSDGTGNSAIKGRGTNVFKLYEAVDTEGHKARPGLRQQIAIYDDGVGTESLRLPRVLGGAFGWGLSRNVRQLYAELARAYDPGDKIYLFGFSRGAFTVRTLAGFIVMCGILSREKCGTDAGLAQRTEEAYALYRCRYRSALSRAWDFLRGRVRGGPAHGELVKGFQEKWCAAPDRTGDFLIEFIGVWDTVDAVGLPVDELAKFLNYAVYQFKFSSSRLSRRVRRACHALSIDDERHAFHPVMWDEPNAAAGQIEQVWFAGVHANVGGGYPKQGMSLVSLDWMMAHANAAGLRFIPRDWDSIREHQSVFDKLYDSRAGLAGYYHYTPRDIRKLCAENRARVKIHVSALERIAQGTEGYAPANIPRNFKVAETRGSGKAFGGAVKAIRDALPKSKSPLGLVQKEVGLRRRFHAYFVASSLAGLAAILFFGAEDASWRSVLGVVGSVASLDLAAMLELLRRGWVRHPSSVAMLIAMPVCSYLAGNVEKRKMARAIGAFWSGLRSELRRSL